MYEILFHGAAGEVTGSMHMIRFDGRWIALDCGMFQGHRADAEDKNRTWPMPPSEIAAVVLSHAHIDHSGRLPKLMKDDFRGAIHCTSATRDLCSIMLADSAHIQSEDTPYVNKRRARQGLAPITALYDAQDATAAVGQMHQHDFAQSFPVVPGLEATFIEAGHMLGSAGIRLDFRSSAGAHASLYFSGDVGRNNTPILHDPAPFPKCETVLCEATYGGRVNESPADAEQRMLNAVKSALGRGGKVIVPAFSVGRTQTIVYFLRKQIDAGHLVRMPIYVDSPLAVSATEVYRKHPECYDEDATDFQRRTGALLGEGLVTYIRDVEESKRLNDSKTPCVIISASGMCESGRIQHHIRNNVADSRNLILIPGFQAEGTLGRKLVDGIKKVNLFHETLNVRAEIVQIHGFSGHADQNGLLTQLMPLKGVANRVFLVHAEREESTILAERLCAASFPEVTVAQRGQRVTI